MTVFRTATLRTFFFAIFTGAKELILQGFALKLGILFHFAIRD